jgi:hypothetical protein
MPSVIPKATVEAALSDPHVADLTGPMQAVFDALADATGGYRSQDYTAIALTLVTPEEPTS